MYELRSGYLKNNKTHSTLHLHVWKVSAPQKGQAQNPVTLRIPCLSSLPFCYWKESLFNGPTHQVTRQLLSKVSPKPFSLNYRRQSGKLHHSESSKVKLQKPAYWMRNGVHKGTVPTWHGLDTKTGIFLQTIPLVTKWFTQESSFSLNFSLYGSCKAWIWRKNSFLH